ncbi:MAG: hypothetical protein Q9169_008260 [Polycauliona sp. 2 TL-2023]
MDSLVALLEQHTAVPAWDKLDVPEHERHWQDEMMILEIKMHQLHLRYRVIPSLLTSNKREQFHYTYPLIEDSTIYQIVPSAMRPQKDLPLIGMSRPLTDANLAVISKMFPNDNAPHKKIAPYIDLLFAQQFKMSDLASETGSKVDLEAEEQWNAALDPATDVAVEWYEAIRMWAVVGKKSK